jgi:hypothetical protein
MMETTCQDSAQRTFQRDAEARIGMARELSALPEAEAAAQWDTAVQRLQSAGFGQGLPEQFPGLERLRAVAGSDVTGFQRMQASTRRGHWRSRVSTSRPTLASSAPNWACGARHWRCACGRTRSAMDRAQTVLSPAEAR